MRRAFTSLTLLALAGCATTTTVPKTATAVAPQAAPAPPQIEVVPATPEPTELALGQEATALELPGGDRVLAGQFGIAADDGLAQGPSRFDGLIRIAPDGTERWRRECGVQCTVIGLALAPGGDIIAAGTFGGSADFGDGTHLDNYDSAFVTRVDAATGKARWFWSDRGWFGSWSQVTRVGVDAQGDVLAAGWFQHAIDLGKGYLRSPAWGEGFAARLSGKDGSLIWGGLVPGGSKAIDFAIPLPDGDALFMGYAGRGGPRIGPLHERESGVVLERVSPQGQVRWVRRSGGEAMLNPYSAIADGAGGAWVSGAVLGRATLGKSIIAADARGRDAPFVMHLDGRGEPTMVRVFADSSAMTQFQGMAPLPGGRLAVSGVSWGARKLGRFEIPARLGINGRPSGTAFVTALDPHGEISTLGVLPGASGSAVLAPAGDAVDALVVNVVEGSPSSPTRVGTRLLRWSGSGAAVELPVKIAGPVRWVGHPPNLRKLWADHQFVCPAGRVTVASSGHGVSCLDQKTGLLDGPFWTWTMSGEAVQVGARHEGQLAGRSRVWMFNLPMIIDELYEPDQSGWVIGWYRPGLAQSVRTFSAGRKSDGIAAEFDESGHLTKMQRREDGAVSEVREFEPSGALRYSQDRLGDGTLQTRELWPNGNRRLEGRFERDGYHREGDWTFWYPSGTKACEESYANGTPVRATQYLPDGQVLGSIAFENGREVSRTGAPIVIRDADVCR